MNKKLGRINNELGHRYENMFISELRTIGTVLHGDHNREIIDCILKLPNNITHYIQIKSNISDTYKLPHFSQIKRLKLIELSEQKNAIPIIVYCFKKCTEYVATNLLTNENINYNIQIINKNDI